MFLYRWFKVGTKRQTVSSAVFLYCSSELSTFLKLDEEVCRRAGTERKLESRVDQSVLTWFGRVESWMSTYGQKGVDGGSKWRWIRGRPRLG